MTEADTKAEEPEAKEPEETEAGLEGLKTQVKALTKEATKRKKELRREQERTKDLGEKVQEFEDKDKTGLESLTEKLVEAQKKVSTYETEIATTQIKATVLVEAMRAGAIDPEIVYKAVPVGDITYEEGEVNGATDAINKMKESHPYLFGETSTKPPPPEPGSGGPRPPVDQKESFASAFSRAMKKK